MAHTLRSVPLFDRLDDAALDRLERASESLRLDAGRVLFSEGDPGDRAYVIRSGSIEILKQTGDREIVLAVRGPGDVIGEIALLQECPRSATARASTDGTFLAIPKAALDALMMSSADVTRALFGVVLERWQSTQDELRQRERMAQLGTLTAGLAHELNNPAAAVTRSVSQLRHAIEALASAHRGISGGLAEPVQTAIDGVLARLGETDRPGDIDPITRSRREQQVEAALETAGVADAWSIGPDLVEMGLEGLVPDVIAATGADAGDILRVARAHALLASMLDQIEMATSRMTAIVKALKSYSYLDQAPIQDVDVRTGIEDTLVILAAKLRDIEVVRQISDQLPRVEGYGGELNQVWTNLIDNAADAVHQSGRSDGVVTIRAFPEEDRIVVEVEDNGVGIPASAKDQVFDSFFTTKPPGAGTGLGLNISFGIVVNKHRGSLTFESEPGRTTFRVVLYRRIG